MKTFSRHLFLLLGVMVWSSLAFGGEIHDAAASGDLKKVQALLKAHPEWVSVKDYEHGAAPLHCAAENDHKAVVEFLLSKGAEINAKDNDGKTPLHDAVAFGSRYALGLSKATNTYKDVAKVLLAHGAEVNAKNNDGDTPLHIVAALGSKDMNLWPSKATNTYKDVAKLLLAHGAEVDAKDKDGDTPLYIAVQRNNNDVVEVLLAHKAEYTIQEMAAIGDLKTVQALLKDHPEWISAKDGDGLTPLHWAAERGHTEAAEWLLANGANVNAKSNYGRTP